MGDLGTIGMDHCRREAGGDVMKKGELARFDLSSMQLICPFERLLALLGDPRWLGPTGDGKVTLIWDRDEEESRRFLVKIWDYRSRVPAEQNTEWSFEIGFTHHAAFLGLLNDSRNIEEAEEMRELECGGGPETIADILCQRWRPPTAQEEHDYQCEGGYVASFRWWLLVHRLNDHTPAEPDIIECWDAQRQELVTRFQVKNCCAPTTLTLSPGEQKRRDEAERQEWKEQANGAD